MKVEGDYDRDGFALVRSAISPEIARAFLQGLKQDIGDRPLAVSQVTEHPNLLKRAAFEIYGMHYRPMQALLWGLTPMVSQIIKKDLVPTYDYFRIYQETDVCKVHSDRYSCEHSMSLTLDYSDGEPWSLEMERKRTEPSARVVDDFGGSPYASILMEVGDAVLYQGVHHRHGRMTPNPNGWSAHLFLHWVERGGPHGDHAFDQTGIPAPVNFTFS